jgi:uncharacterized protein DUF4276
MARLLVHVEGDTEEDFVNEVLRPYLVARGFESVAGRKLGPARERARRGGIPGWNTARTEIIRHLRQDTGCIGTTMVDYYGLPRTGERAWPGRAESASWPVRDRGVRVQAALLANLSAHVDGRRFIPFVVVHEFEGLLFSDCRTFADSIGRRDLAASFQAIRDAFETPEHIDNSPTTAPSKRVERLMPTYQKPLLGNLAALEIGLDKIKAECPHFASWLGRLEALVAS